MNGEYKESLQEKETQGRKMGTDSSDDMDLLELIDKNRLAEFQQAISNATGLAFITVNYRGEPVTEATNFTRHCACMREDEKCKLNCFASDAYGAVQAAVLREPHVYFCPHGLIEMAVPIIIKGHYLGGFIGGQLRCEDAPPNVSCLAKISSVNETEEHREERQRMLEEVRLSSYKKVKDVAKMVSLIINTLCVKELWGQEKNDSLQQEFNKIVEGQNMWLAERKKLQAELRAMETRYNPHFIMDSLFTVYNMAVLEKAEATAAIMNDVSEYVKSTIMKPWSEVSVKTELASMERYLRIKKVKYQDNLVYHINFSDDILVGKIMRNILLPFLEYSVFFGTAQLESAGEITLTGFVKNGDNVVTIENNGPGVEYAEVPMDGEGHFIQMSMKYAEMMLKEKFGERYGVKKRFSYDVGCSIVISWPEFY